MGLPLSSLVASLGGAYRPPGQVSSVLDRRLDRKVIPRRRDAPLLPTFRNANARGDPQTRPAVPLGSRGQTAPIVSSREKRPPQAGGRLASRSRPSRAWASS